MIPISEHETPNTISANTFLPSVHSTRGLHKDFHKHLTILKKWDSIHVNCPTSGPSITQPIYLTLYKNFSLLQDLSHSPIPVDV